MESLKSICVLLLILPAVSRCLRIVFEESTALTENQDDSVNVKHEYQREKRSGDTNLKPRQNCNTWSPWIDRNHPTENEPNNRERVSQQDIEAFCPPKHGERVTNISCKDEKGETYFGNRTGANNEHFLSCYSPAVGAECVLLIKSFKSCPDMIMRYFCSCSNETSVTSSPDMSTTTHHQYSTLNNEMPPKNAEKQNSYPTDGFNAGRLFVPWWGLYLLIALVLFSICMCTTVCMYKHLQKKLRDGKHGTRVHPTA